LTTSDVTFDTVIVRLGGEIGIKAAWTRKWYEQRLISNIKAALKHHTIQYSEIVKKFGRLFIKTPQAEETAEKLAKVFGVSSLSPASETTSDLNDILNASITHASSKFKKEKTFAVRCRRVGKHPYTSQDICRLVGQEILNHLPEQHLQVNLTNPYQTLHIEIREQKAYMFTNIIKGVGGLPLGTQPKLICLLDAAESSATACWMTMKRGSPTVLVHFKKEAPIDKLDLGRTIKHAEKLMDWAIGYPRRLHIVEHSPRFTQEHSSELNDILCKRLMLRIAQRIAEKEAAEGIVTGDKLVKKGSQTLHALRIQDETVKGYPIHRPLIGLDVNEIEEIAQKIGLEKAMLPKFEETPRTVIELEEIREIERELNLTKIIEEALKSLRNLQV
jgi:thiamine biosynthesis protein ThiI